MSLLLEDLAAETAAGNQRLAARLTMEAADLQRLLRQLEELGENGPAPNAPGDEQPARISGLEELRQRALESARLATDYALSRMGASEVVWCEALSLLRKDPKRDEADRFLRAFLDGLKSGQQLIRSVRELWTASKNVGLSPESFEELDRAEEWLLKRADEAKLALEHRTSGWQPREPERFALGLSLAREGKTVTAAEARARFRRPQG